VVRNDGIDNENLVRINFEWIQQPLRDLAETIGQKMYREAPRLLASPPYVGPNMFSMIRQAKYTCDLLFYLHADDHRQNDCYWKQEYTFVSAPLIRTLIDCLFNITLILENPKDHGPLYCMSGFKKELNDLDEDVNRYAGQPEWDRYILEKRRKIQLGFQVFSLDEAEVRATKSWPTLGKYLQTKGPGGALSPHQQFLKTFAYGMWREYSAISHGGFEGLLDAAGFYTRDALPHEQRDGMDAIHHRLMSFHMARAALILLCIVTEIQAHFRFTDANIMLGSASFGMRCSLSSKRKSFTSSGMTP
jgi:hypothetical protein